MLISLEIRDMLLIDRLELEFQPGLNVLTGETGAGKSILLDCLGFVLGWKGRADLVRQGADAGEVTAVFFLPDGHASAVILAEAGLPAGDEIVVRRTLTTDGRRSAFVNDRRTSAEILRALGDTLVELHGQHDDTGLLNPRGHRRLLDAFAGAGDLLAQTRAGWGELQTARRALAAGEAALQAMRSEEDFLRHAVTELDKLSPEPGEDATLDARRRMMQAASRIRDDVSRAAQALGPDGAEGLLSDARRWLDGAADKAEGVLDESLTSIERAMTELGEAQSGIERALDAMTFDPRDLEATEERLFAIRGLARKHGVAPDALGGFAEDLRARLATLDGGAGNIDRLTAEVATAEAAHRMACAGLSALRHRAAKDLDAAMAGELPPLKLDRAVFSTDITAVDPGPDGADAVAFTVATNPGAPAGPIDRIASGGELSRFLLALKVCLARGGDATTLIFDEIDRGVGGATADAVGRRLARLAGSAQVLVVTHSPQVAARGAHHWRVEKRVTGDITTSTVVALSPLERRDEIARMLSGDTITEAARDAATALLSS